MLYEVITGLDHTGLRGRHFHGGLVALHGQQGLVQLNLVTDLHQDFGDFHLIATDIRYMNLNRHPQILLCVQRVDLVGSDAELGDGIHHQFVITSYSIHYTKLYEVVTKGRHDPCVGIRAVPVAEAMMACVILDHLLLDRAQTGGIRGEIG